MSDEELISVDQLIERYAIEGRAEFAEDEAREARERLEAAFEAGAMLGVLEPLSIYDPVDGKPVEVRSEGVVEVADHEVTSPSGG